MTRPADNLRSRNIAASRALTVSAVILAGLLAAQLGRLAPFGAGPAYAGNVSEIADSVVLTADAGNQEDVCLILDRRAEQLTVYGVDQRTLVFLATYDVGGLFNNARAAAGGRRR